MVAAIRTATEIDTDDVSAMLAALDAALAAHRLLLPHLKIGVHAHTYRFITLMASMHPHAEYTMKLWASAQGLVLMESVHRYDDILGWGPGRIRVLNALLDGVTIAAVQYDSEPIPLDIPPEAIGLVNIDEDDEEPQP